MTHRESLRGTLTLLRMRFREARLGQVAGSLTFTTLLALVPLLTVMLALFSAFPVFASFQDGLEKFFLQSLVPDSIARPVLKTVTEFATKATRLGALGVLGVMASALALMLTIDRALNRIWRVRQPRPFSQRLLIYTAAMTLGPLAVGIGFTLASYAFTASRGWGPVMPLILRWLLDLLETGALMVGAMALYRFLPHTHVRWRDALLGGAFVVAAFGLAKWGLGLYVTGVSTYAAVYGAFATLPILLLWIYIVWVIVLTGALLAATAPGLRGAAPLDDRVPGWRFTLALRLLRELSARRDSPEPSLDLLPLAASVQADPLEVRTVADQLAAWGWLVRVEADGPVAQGYLMRLHPAQCPMGVLVRAWLLAPQPGNSEWLRLAGGEGISLADVL